MIRYESAEVAVTLATLRSIPNAQLANPSAMFPSTNAANVDFFFLTMVSVTIIRSVQCNNMKIKTVRTIVHWFLTTVSETLISANICRTRCPKSS